MCYENKEENHWDTFSFFFQFSWHQCYGRCTRATTAASFSIDMSLRDFFMDGRMSCSWISLLWKQKRMREVKFIFYHVDHACVVGTFTILFNCFINELFSMSFSSSWNKPNFMIEMLGFISPQEWNKFWLTYLWQKFFILIFQLCIFVLKIFNSI